MQSRVARYLAVLTALVCPFTAWAANPNWLTAGDTTRCSLRPGKACSTQWTAAASADSDFIDVRGLVFSLRIEPQLSGADTTARADVYACTSKDGNADGTADTTACTALNWDTDGDGVVDDNTLDPTNPMAIGTPRFMGVVYLYISTTADPPTGTAEVTINAESTAAGAE